MTEVLAVLCMPLAGAVLLAIVGARSLGPLINVGASLATWLASIALTIRVAGTGPMLVADKLFFVDPFNVFLVALTAFVVFTTSIFSRPYMQIEQRHGRLTAARLRLYHSM